MMQVKHFPSRVRVGSEIMPISRHSPVWTKRSRGLKANHRPLTVHMSIDILIRPALSEDIQTCAEICFKSFTDVAKRHGFLPDFLSISTALHLFGNVQALARAGEAIFNVAQSGSCMDEAAIPQVRGSIVLSVRPEICAIMIITVDPEVQHRKIGRSLLSDAIERSQTLGAKGLRLVGAAYNCESMALYTKLGFQVREPLACLNAGAGLAVIPPDSGPNGFPQGTETASMLSRNRREDRIVRMATNGDLQQCNTLCAQILGFTRSTDLGAGIEEGTARTVFREGGRLSGYSTGLGFFGHSIGETNEDLFALLNHAISCASLTGGSQNRNVFSGPGILVPTRNHALMRWCLAHGFQVIQPMNLMTIGQYQDPVGAWIPSIQF